MMLGTSTSVFSSGAATIALLVQLLHPLLSPVRQYVGVVSCVRQRGVRGRTTTRLVCQHRGERGGVQNRAPCDEDGREDAVQQLHEQYVHVSTRRLQRVDTQLRYSLWTVGGRAAHGLSNAPSCGLRTHLMVELQSSAGDTW